MGCHQFWFGSLNWIMGRKRAIGPMRKTTPKVQDVLHQCLETDTNKSGTTHSQ